MASTARTRRVFLSLKYCRHRYSIWQLPSPFPHLSLRNSSSRAETTEGSETLGKSNCGGKMWTRAFAIFWTLVKQWELTCCSDDWRPDLNPLSYTGCVLVKSTPT